MMTTRSESAIKRVDRQQFVDMLNDPGYQAIAPIRAAALAASRLLEMTQLLPKLS